MSFNLFTYLIQLMYVCVEVDGCELNSMLDKEKRTQNIVSKCLKSLCKGLDFNEKEIMKLSRGKN